MNCKDCVNYRRVKGSQEGEHGRCISGKFVLGYWSEFDNGKEYPLQYYERLPADGVRVEGDEGWGFYVGPMFGCIHFSTSVISVEKGLLLP